MLNSSFLKSNFEFTEEINTKIKENITDNERRKKKLRFQEEFETEI